MNATLLSTAIAVSLAAGAPPAFAQGTGMATLRVVVKDPSGAVIPGALVQLTGADDRVSTIARRDIPSDGQGVALAPELPPGRYVVEVSFPGFETLVLPDVRLRAGNNRREVVLAIEKLDELVSVGRDPATAAADPNNDRFSTVLSRDQINALPDDPDEMERVLKEMAGPGATIRVDGFRGGKLPPKAQIRSIRFSRDMFAAENHMAGMVFVDLVTQPGAGRLGGSVDFLFRDDSLNARNAFLAAKGPEQTQQYTFNLNGTLWKQRTSFSLAATGASLYDSANVFAATPDGSRRAPVRRPTDRLSFNGRLDHALTKSHTLRLYVQQSDNEQRNLGVGSFDLGERAYSRTTEDATLRLSESGPWGRSMFGETRLQVRRQSARSFSQVEAPTVRVLDAFTSGGAQQQGGRRATELEWAASVDWARGRHSVRMGALVEAGWYRGDNRTNYLGTYTFASLADYDAGRPATYSRRVGDPLVEFSQWQAGLFVQDDWRARSNLTLSAGLRQELQTNLEDRLNLAPRAGLTWSPFKNGKTTIRAGAGIFYDWLEPETYEQTLRVDGQRQRDLVITDPGYPDPVSGGLSTVLPASRYQLSPVLAMPYRAMVLVGLSQQVTPSFGVNVNYNRSRGYDRFRGRNVNAPNGGSRPDPTAGNVVQVEPTARMRGQTFSTGVNFSIPGRRTFLFANYAYVKQENDADGPFSLPADNYALGAEWGAAAGMPRHNFSAMLTTTIGRSLRVGLSGTARSGAPYNVTTGRDDNGDTVFNDRPAGVARNSARATAQWDVSGRVSYAFGFGRRDPAPGTPGTGAPVIHRVVVGPGGAGGDVLGAFGGGAEDKRVRFELFASVSNLFNTVNRVAYSGVMTSPFFGQPTAAMPGRRVDVGVRVGF